MGSSPAQDSANVVTYEVSAGGSAIPDTYDIDSIIVTKQVNRISTCEIVLFDGDPAKADFPLSDSSTFLPGTEVEIKLGYDSTNASVFKGIVIKQSIRISNEKGPQLELVCKDKAIKMSVGRQNAYYKDMKDSDIISKVIGNHSGLSSDVTATSATLPEVIQYYASDWDFMISRAEVNGLLVTTDAGKVGVSDPTAASDSGIEVTYGQDILEFDATMDATDQFSSVKCSAWDHKTQKVVTGEASGADSGLGNVSTTTLADVIGLSDFPFQSVAPLDEAGLNTWAKAQVTKSEYAKIRGNVRFQGTASALPATTISIMGVGERFEGTAFISAVTHRLEDGDWVCDATIGVDPEWFSENVQMQSPLASGLLPGIQGLHLGTVKQINEDTDSEFRVLVDIPLITTSSDGVWARYGNFYATNKAGIFFYPEVGDEVVLGFLNEDPRYPIILASLYSSSKKVAPYTPDDKNSIKAIVTNAQIKIEFDDENKVLTVTTPGENQMVFSDKDKSITISDQNSNKIEMTSSGITLDSASSMTLKAAQDISITAGTSVSIEGPQSAEMTGASVSVKADMDLGLEGGMTSKLSGGTQVTISGAMVMIN
ncbi:MAG: type VI secretion system tip protein VgrG [Roseivirga sp.]|nr:type VI secretion system tip protein VgrG [Roseivirga sp.]